MNKWLPLSLLALIFLGASFFYLYTNFFSPTSSRSIAFDNNREFDISTSSDTNIKAEVSGEDNFKRAVKQIEEGSNKNLSEKQQLWSYEQSNYVPVSKLTIELTQKLPALPFGTLTGRLNGENRTLKAFSTQYISSTQEYTLQIYLNPLFIDNAENRQKTINLYILEGINYLLDPEYEATNVNERHRNLEQLLEEIPIPFTIKNNLSKYFDLKIVKTANAQCCGGTPRSCYVEESNLECSITGDASGCDSCSDDSCGPGGIGSCSCPTTCEYAFPRDCADPYGVCTAPGCGVPTCNEDPPSCSYSSCGDPPPPTPSPPPDATPAPTSDPTPPAESFDAQGKFIVALWLDTDGNGSRGGSEPYINPNDHPTLLNDIRLRATHENGTRNYTWSNFIDSTNPADEFERRQHLSCESWGCTGDCSGAGNYLGGVGADSYDSNCRCRLRNWGGFWGEFPNLHPNPVYGAQTVWIGPGGTPPPASSEDADYDIELSVPEGYQVTNSRYWRGGTWNNNYNSNNINNLNIKAQDFAGSSEFVVVTDVLMFGIQERQAPECVIQLVDSANDSTVCAGEPFDIGITASDPQNNLDRVEIFSADTTDSPPVTWSGASCNGSGCTHPTTISIDTPGDHYVVCNAFDTDGNWCSGNPWCEWDPNPPNDLSCQSSLGVFDCAPSNVTPSDIFTVDVQSCTYELEGRVVENLDPQVACDANYGDLIAEDGTAFGGSVEVNGSGPYPVDNDNPVFPNSGPLTFNYGETVDMTLNYNSNVWNLACVDSTEGQLSILSPGDTARIGNITRDFLIAGNDEVIFHLSDITASPLGWWQSIGGDIAAISAITNQIPYDSCNTDLNCEPVLTRKLNNENNTTGVVVDPSGSNPEDAYFDETAPNNPDTGEENNWLAVTNPDPNIGNFYTYMRDTIVEFDKKNATSIFQSGPQPNTLRPLFNQAASTGNSFFRTNRSINIDNDGLFTINQNPHQEVYWYIHDNSSSQVFTLNRRMRITNQNKLTIFVDGDVSIKRFNTWLNEFIIVDPGSYFGIIASGNIYFDGNLTENDSSHIGAGSSTTVAEGVYIAQGNIYTCANGFSDQINCLGKFRFEGSLIAGSDIIMSHTLDNTPDNFSYENDSDPAHQFIFRPDLMINMPPELKRIQSDWIEQAP